jgi:acyl dehydratase
MPLDYDMLMSLRPWETRHPYARRDTILYALGVGAGAENPSDPDELLYVYEEGLEALPTMAVVLGYPGFWQKEPQYKLDWRRIVHADQAVQFHQPLPVEGEVRSLISIDAIYDKGADKGALLYWRRELFDTANGSHLATIRQGSFLRGDGGFGGSPDGAPLPAALPVRAPDRSVALPTRPEQALIYRLSGDYNPLHADPAVAAAAGFDRPILHGLCTFGLLCRALLKATGAKASALASMGGRFSSPVFPGETIRADIWMEDDAVRFRGVVTENERTIFNNGQAIFR